MDRRSLLRGSGLLIAAQALTIEAGARAKLTPVSPEDEKFTQLAIDQAKHADHPFGAIIVREGRVLALGQNSTKRKSDPTAHAEMMAIRAFLDGHEPEAFKEATLYASGEPCVMCMGAIIWCGIKRVVFAASIGELEKRIGQIEITCRQIANAAPFASVEITGGVLHKEAIDLFADKIP